MNVNPNAVVLVAFGAAVGALWGAVLIGLAVTLGILLASAVLWGAVSRG